MEMRTTEFTDLETSLYFARLAELGTSRELLNDID